MIRDLLIVLAVVTLATPVAIVVAKREGPAIAFGVFMAICATAGIWFGYRRTSGFRRR